MILVDTSIWIDHLRAGDQTLSTLLNDGHVATHPFVIGELACGNLRQRSEVLRLLDALPKVPVASDREVLYFIERNRLMGRGVGYVDAHLLTATALGDGLRLWTRDRRLNDVAVDLGMAV
jgi:predicted nucleic acid-binding protein